MSAARTLNSELVVLIIIWNLWQLRGGGGGSLCNKFIILVVKMVYCMMSAFSQLLADILPYTIFTKRITKIQTEKKQKQQSLIPHKCSWLIANFIKKILVLGELMINLLPWLWKWCTARCLKKTHQKPVARPFTTQVHLWLVAKSIKKTNYLLYTVVWYMGDGCEMILLPDSTHLLYP